MLALPLLSVAVLAVVATPAPAANGEAVGQDPIRLALTICSNAGPGDGAEVEAALLTRSISSDCLKKAFRSRYTADEIAAILAQANCIGPFLGSFVCEVDPGNSAEHNNAGA